MARPKKEETSEKKLGIRPLSGYLIVQPSEAETQTSSGIYLPESAQEKPAQGMVIACGDEMVKVGDKVIYKKWGGDEIKFGGKELKLVKFDDLMAILE